MPLKDFSGPVQAVYAKCVDKLLQNTARHLNNAFSKGQWGSLDWDAYVLREMGQLNKANMQAIAAATAEGAQLTEEAVSEAMALALERASPDLKAGAAAGILAKPKPAGMTKAMTGILQSYAGQAADQANLVNTVMLQSSKDAARRVVSEVIASQAVLRETTQGVLNTATGEVLTGVNGLQAAVRGAVKELVDGGITGFVDKAGRTWSPEAYIGMAVRTTAANAAMDAVMKQNEEYGVTLVIVPTNASARPKCAPYQGKVLSMSGGSGTTYDRYGRGVEYIPIGSTTYGEPDGLFGINCHHKPPDPYVPGISLNNLEPSGKVEERYEQSQVQRKLERDVRQAKREAACLDAAGDKAGFQEAAARVKERTRKLQEYCDTHKLTYRGDRTQVYGYNKSVGAKVGAVWRVRQPPKPKAPARVLNFAERREADDYFRPITGKIWATMTPSERAAAYRYTQGSGGFNRPLRGYDTTWDSSSFEGIGNVPLDNEGCEREMNNLTQLLDRCELPETTMLYRDADRSGVAAFLGVERGEVSESNAQRLADIVVGRKKTDAGFLSTSACVDSSFGDPILFIINAPKGTKGLYVEPFSHYAAAKVGVLWDGKTGADVFGNEMEIILQRGGNYLINKVYVGTEGRARGRLTIEMEVMGK